MCWCRERRRGAFSLIELLVVMVMIGTVAALLLPVFSKVRENAKLARCQNNLRSIGDAVMMYLSDWNEMFPIGYAYEDPGKYRKPVWVVGQGVGGKTGRDQTLPYEDRRPLWRYTGHNRRIFSCPSEPKLMIYPLGYITDYEYFGNSYPMNLVFGAPPGVPSANGLIYTLAGVRSGSQWRYSRKLSSIYRPSKMILMGERGIHQYWKGGQPTDSQFRNHDQDACRVPVCFADGHVQYVLMTPDHQVTVRGRQHRTYGLWDKGWALMEQGWIPDAPEVGMPPDAT